MEIPETSLKLIPDEEWVQFCIDRKAKPWYAIHTALYPRGFFVKRDDTIYIKSSQAGNEQLKCHELGHRLGFHHPNDMFAAIKHALKVRDTRAFSGIFRLKKGPVQLWDVYESWCDKYKY